VLWTGALNCPVCHRTVSCAPCLYKVEPATLRFSTGTLHYNSPDCPVCHRTVRCTSGAMAIQRNGRLQRRPDSATVENSARQSQSVESKAHRTVNRTYPVWHRTVRCRIRTKPPTVNCSRTLTVGWCGGAPDSLQDLSGGTPDYPVRPSTAAFPNGLLVVEGYKYPQPPQLQASKCSKVPIKYKS
jgi:hypothetical protein